MSAELPEYFFRVRENGAMVFRIDTENRQNRIEMDQIAVVNVKNGDVKAHGQTDLSDVDRAAIDDWLNKRRRQLADREVDDILRTVDRLNLTAAWAQQKASPEELNAVSDALLLAMHDLRSVLVRKKSDQLRKDAAE
ncbi:hypothetical protein N9L47_12435 [Rhodobacteraceae bacterium]|nr:hypothetical protein [Paracoccaceae bacterium]